MSTLPSSTADDEKTPNRPLIHSKEAWFVENYEEVQKTIEWLMKKMDDKQQRYLREICVISFFYDFVYIAGGGALTNYEIAILKSSNKKAASLMNQCVEYLAMVGVPKGLDKEGFVKWRGLSNENFIMKYHNLKPLRKHPK